MVENSVVLHMGFCEILLMQKNVKMTHIYQHGIVYHHMNQEIICLHFLVGLQENLDVYVEEGYLEETAIVVVDQTWEETHGAIGGETYEYIPEGRYEKYFVLGLIDGNWELLMTMM